MSEHGAEAIQGVSWPSNGLSEVPFRLYTDPDQYRLEQERIFKGPA
jgi:anthranilate 1,2-dioxygenase large subunit